MNRKTMCCNSAINFDVDHSKLNTKTYIFTGGPPAFSKLRLAERVQEVADENCTLINKNNSIKIQQLEN